ncbi:MAG TPA: GNAT family N-acetyltransferase [Rhizomicrobium sp.]|jgi:GNAT superfamily N-acetyltransferase
MTKIIVREARKDDFAQWEPLWDGYTRFYEREPDAKITLWNRAFDVYEPIHILVAEMDGRIVGIVHYLYHRSTSLIGPVCYLQDLFTEDGLRGKGVGRALIEAVYAKAKEAGAARVYWMTHETNTTAMKLYDNIAEKSGFLQYRKNLG